MTSERMRQVRRRMPATTLPESKAFSYALVLARNPYGEHTALPRIMDFPILVLEVRAKDKPHAFSLLVRIMYSHDKIGLSSWQATSEPVAELQQKTRSAGLRDKSFGKDREELVFARDFALFVMDFHNSHCKSK